MALKIVDNFVTEALKIGSGVLLTASIMSMTADDLKAAIGKGIGNDEQLFDKNMTYEPRGTEAAKLLSLNEEVMIASGGNEDDVEGFNDRDKIFKGIVYDNPETGSDIESIAAVLAVMAKRNNTTQYAVTKAFQEYLNRQAATKGVGRVSVTGNLTEEDFKLIQKLRGEVPSTSPTPAPKNTDTETQQQGDSTGQQSDEVDIQTQSMSNEKLSKKDFQFYARLIFLSSSRKNSNETLQAYILRNLATRHKVLSRKNPAITQREVNRQFQEAINCYVWEHIEGLVDIKDIDKLYNVEEDGILRDDLREYIPFLQTYTEKIRNSGKQENKNETIAQIEDEQAFRNEYMTDKRDINPWIPLDKEARLWGNSERYMNTAKQQIMKFFSPNELLELHNRIQSLPPAERVVEVALAFEAKRHGNEHMKFADCNNFVTACWVFAGLGDERNTSTTKSLLAHTSDNWQSFGELEFEYTGETGKNEVTDLEVNGRPMGRDVLPQRGDRVYVYQSGTREEHSGIALGPIEIKQGSKGLEAWLWIISQPYPGLGPIIEPRRIARRGGPGMKFRYGYYGINEILGDKEYIDGRYDRDKSNYNKPKIRANRLRFGHTIKKLDRPVDPTDN